MGSERDSPNLNAHQELEMVEESVERLSSNSDTSTGSACSSSNGFDCNICLEFVQDPVVSLCGHLYCWPCIYKWIHFNNVSYEDPDHQPQCPVCKSEVSVSALVPIYGRGKDMNSREHEDPNSGLTIPQRPSAPIYRDISPAMFGNNQQLPEPYNHDGPYSASSSVVRLGGASSFQPIIENFGEMLHSRMFGQPVFNADGYTNSYSIAAVQSPRMRRQLMRDDQSLSRLCFFFFCCMIFCLLLF